MCVAVRWPDRSMTRRSAAVTSRPWVVCLCVATHSRSLTRSLLLCCCVACARSGGDRLRRDTQPQTLPLSLRCVSMLLVLSFSLTCMRAAVLLLLLLLLLLPRLLSASFTIARSLGLCCLPVRRRRRRCHPCVSTRFPCVRTCRPQAVVAWFPLLYVHSLGSRRTTDP